MTELEELYIKIGKRFLEIYKTSQYPESEYELLGNASVTSIKKCNTQTSLFGIDDDSSKELEDEFNHAWIAYGRKGSKKKSNAIWMKMSIEDRRVALESIPYYTRSRDFQFQKDFERYLRDETFKSPIVGKDGQILYDLEKSQNKAVSEPTKSIEVGSTKTIKKRKEYKLE